MAFVRAFLLHQSLTDIVIVLIHTTSPENSRLLELKKELSSSRVASASLRGIVAAFKNLVHGGVFVHEAYEAKKIKIFFCYLNTSHRHRFCIYVYYLNLLELRALHPAQPSALVLYFNYFTLTLLDTGRSLDHRNPTGAQRAASARSGFLIVCCSDCTPASFRYASASFTHSHTLSLDCCCRPTAGKSSSPAGLSTLGYAYCAPASAYAYSSSTHRFPDERTPIEATPLSATSVELGLGLGLGLGLDSLVHLSSHALPLFSPPSFHTLSLSPAFTIVVVRLVHTSLGSSYLIAHVLHYPPPPRAQLCIRYCSNKQQQPPAELRLPPQRPSNAQKLLETEGDSVHVSARLSHQCDASRAMYGIPAAAAPQL